MERERLALLSSCLLVMSFVLMCVLTWCFVLNLGNKFWYGPY